MFPNRVVQVWWAELNIPGWENFLPVLSADEQDRAARFVFVRDRRRFAASRGVLRNLLCQHIGGRPENVRFTYSAKGKPALIDHFHHARIHFNLSHSEEIVVVGLACEPLGVDVEYLGRPVEEQAIAARLFSPAEMARFHELSPDQRTRGILQCWTRKEALVKAKGDGLSLPLEDFTVTFSPGEPPRIVALGGNTRVTEDWWLFHLEPAPDYVGAVAIRGRDWKLTVRQVDAERLL